MLFKLDIMANRVIISFKYGLNLSEEMFHKLDLVYARNICGKLQLFILNT